MTRREFIEKMKQQLDEFNQRMEELEARGALYKQEVRAGFEKQMQELRRTREQLSKRLDEINQAGDRAWEDLRNGATAAWNSLQEKLKQALAKFK